MPEIESGIFCIPSRCFTVKPQHFHPVSQNGQPDGPGRPIRQNTKPKAFSWYWPPGLALHLWTWKFHIVITANSHCEELIFFLIDAENRKRDLEADFHQVEVEITFLWIQPLAICRMGIWPSDSYEFYGNITKGILHVCEVRKHGARLHRPNWLWHWCRKGVERVLLHLSTSSFLLTYCCSLLSKECERRLFILWKRKR